MSKNIENFHHIKSNLANIVMLALIFSSLLYIILNENRTAAMNDVWSHFKNLSLIVIGYFFGQKH
jgi:hypothetical protein